MALYMDAAIADAVDQLPELEASSCDVFRCVHAPWVKLGHHKISPARPNVYYRVAGRGFHSCVHPRELDGKLSVDDLELVAWYPSLTRRDEGRLHRSFDRVGEFHPEAELPAILQACDRLGPRVAVPEDDRVRALAWASRKCNPREKA